MFVVKPLSITPAKLVSSTARTSAYPDWTAGRTWPRGSRAYLPSTNKDYEALANIGLEDTSPTQSLFNPALANDHPFNAGKTWIEVGYANRWAPFDLDVVGRTDDARDVSWVIRPDQPCNTVAVFGMGATAIRVFVRNAGGTIVYDQFRQLRDTTFVDDAFDMIAPEGRFRRDILFRGVPAYVGHTVTVNLLNAFDGPRRVAAIVLGREYQIGTALLGVQTGLVSYSRKDVDVAGSIRIRRRPYSRTVTYPVRVEPLRINGILDFMGSLLDTPAVYHTGADSTAMGAMVYGLFKGSGPTIEAPNFATLSLEVEGLNYGFA